MSINIAIANAYSGLSAQSRLAEVVSRNVANASTEGYAAREVTLSNRVISEVGAGVKVDGPTRAGDAFLTADRRRADGRASGEDAAAKALAALSALAAPVDGEGGLATAYARFDTALRSLEAGPESPAAQSEAVNAARMMAETLQTVTTEARRIRVDADSTIRRQVDSVNAALRRIEQLNSEIREAVATNRDPTTLADERDRQIEVVNAIVPIRAAPREGGGVTLLSQGGAVLVDERAQQLSFTPTPAFTDDVTINTGLSGVQIYGTEAAPTAANSSRLLSGGALEASFRTRDEVAPLFTAQLDALARDLIERFQDPAVDATLAVGDAGLFVDGGGSGPALDATTNPGQQVGLASRIMLNAAVDPEQGGEVWRIRDGVNAATESPDAADATLARAMVDALNRARTPAGPVAPDAPTTALDPTGFTQPKSAMALAEGVIALRETMADRAEQGAAFALGSASALREAELRVTAVDTDAELRNLLAVEKAYAANARVLQTVDEMLNRILEI